MSDYWVLVTQSVLLLIHEEEGRENVSRFQEDIYIYILAGELHIMVFQHWKHLLTVWLQNRTSLKLQENGHKKKRILLSSKISEDCGPECVCFFPWLKASHPQIQTSRWLPETLWNQQAACLGHIILVSWPLDLSHGILFHLGLIQGYWRGF